MPEWVERLLIAGGGLTMLGAMGKAWWNAWREDRKNKADKVAAAEKKAEDERQAEMARLRMDKREADERVEKMQARFESVLMDAKAKAEDDHAQRAESIATNKQLAAVTTAMIAALDRANAINARLTKDGT